MPTMTSRAPPSALKGVKKLSNFVFVFIDNKDDQIKYIEEVVP